MTLRVRELALRLRVGRLLRLGNVLGGVAGLILRVGRAAKRLGNALFPVAEELADALARQEKQRACQQQEVEDGADGS